MAPANKSGGDLTEAYIYRCTSLCDSRVSRVPIFAEALAGMDSTVLVKTGIGSLHARLQAHPSHENPQSVSAAPPLRGILKCLGIRYGEVPYRWAAPRLAQTPWPGTQDFTQFGPECPQIQEPLFNVAGLPVFGASSATSVSISAQKQDEFGCLNLNVYTPVELGPDGTIQNKSALPVMVWVHGGAFRAGSGGVDLYGNYC